MMDRAPLDIMDPQIAASEIPREWPAWVGGDWGGGQYCAICTEAISATQAEVRARFRDEDSRTFHVRCFLEWWRNVAATRLA